MFSISFWLKDQYKAIKISKESVKTSKLLNSCIGGVLFIDEVYSLGPGQKDKDSFSKEAIDTLCGFLSEHKNDFCCIIAGYEEEIQKAFFGSNPGLERRFPFRYTLKDYTDDQLKDIMIRMIRLDDLMLDTEVQDSDLKNLFKDKRYFENWLGYCHINKPPELFLTIIGCSINISLLKPNLTIKSSK